MKSDSLYYIHKDYQGSMETITDDNGVVLEKLSFDPWGRRRNPTNWSYNTLGLPSKHFDRGYTMHSLSRTCFGKHHAVFVLINMPVPISETSSGNGRVYDPWLGRMLSPDPFMQDPTNTQNYNRYTYALNNPLKYIDPSGYIHGSVFKPGDWDTGIGAGGALYINTWFNNDYAGNAFGSYEDRHTYSYDNSTETWTNGVGQQVSPKEVYANKSWTQEEFNNFVESNSQMLPGNTDLNSIEAKDGGYQYYTIDPTSSPLWSSSSNELNLHFVRGGKGNDQAGGGGLLELTSGTERGVGLFGSLWGGAATMTYADEVANGVSATSKGLTYLKVGGNTLGGFGFAATSYNNWVKIQNGTINTADYVDWGVSGGMLLTGLLITNPVGLTILAVGGVGYGVYRLAAGDAADIWINENFGFRP